jgi:hypothetical protein
VTERLDFCLRYIDEDKDYIKMLEEKVDALKEEEKQNEGLKEF